MVLFERKKKKKVLLNLELMSLKNERDNFTLGVCSQEMSRCYKVP